MKAYIDLSLIVHVVIFFISMNYAIILNEKVKPSKSYKSHSFFISLISFLLNLYYIPYFFLFHILIRFFIIFIGKKNYIKTEILTFVFYYLNVAFLLLVGGTFIYEGILYINRPIATLFIFVFPLITSIIIVIEKKHLKILKKQNFIYKAKLIIDKDTFPLKGYLDSANTAMKKELPVIFVNFSLKSYSDEEEIMIQGINDYGYQKGYKAKIKIKNNTFECYVVSIPTLHLKNHCNCLLNINLLI